jgi:hypothetical protein
MAIPGGRVFLMSEVPLYIQHESRQAEADFIPEMLALGTGKLPPLG